MSQTITLTLPDKLYSPIERLAKSANQSIESVLLTALQATLPPLEKLPADLIQDLTNLESLNNQELRQVLVECVPAQQQEQLEVLLHKNQAGILTDNERIELNKLQHEADKVMLRKARAAILLRFRGQRLPTLGELSHLSDCA